MLFSIFFRFVMNIYVCSGATELLCTFRGIYSLQQIFCYEYGQVLCLPILCAFIYNYSLFSGFIFFLECMLHTKLSYALMPESVFHESTYFFVPDLKTDR